MDTLINMKNNFMKKRDKGGAGDGGVELGRGGWPHPPTPDAPVPNPHHLFIKFCNF